MNLIAINKNVIMHETLGDSKNTFIFNTEGNLKKWSQDKTSNIFVIDKLSSRYHVNYLSLRLVSNSKNIKIFNDIVIRKNLSDVVKILSKMDLYKNLQYYFFELAGLSKKYFKNQIINNYNRFFYALKKKNQCYIYGSGRLGNVVFNALSQAGIEIINFIDNGKAGSIFNGIEVIKQSQVPKFNKNIPVVIATTIHTNSILKSLVKGSFDFHAPYAVMTLTNPNAYPEEIPYIGIQSDLANNAKSFLELFIELADNNSRKVLDNIVAYRLTYNLSFIDKIYHGIEDHYFDRNIIKPRPSEVFVDLGAFDGDSAESFIKHYRDYTGIYLFEPDINILSRAKVRLKHYKDINYINAGAYSKNGVVRFNESGVTNGSIVDDGVTEISVKKVDSLKDNNISFIKMDIEGAEYEALKGAKSIIKKNKPRLAIATYHKAYDLWKLPKVINKLNENYKFYLRHYSNTGLETVLYAI
jgi:FkbM family methyltransferase